MSDRATSNSVCNHAYRYVGHPPTRCDKPAGHKGVHYANTPMGGIAWPTAGRKRGRHGWFEKAAR